MELTLEEKFEKIKDLRPIDDVFFEVLAADPRVCEEILQTILEDPGLAVESVIPQDTLPNLYSRSVRLDALCVLGNGKRVNIEVQRSDSDDHLRRVRFNAAAVTVHGSHPGTDFRQIPDVIVVFITEFDFLRGGKTIYHVDKVLRETGTVIDDGQQEIYVNTVVDDGSRIADLMSCFTKKQVENRNFPVLSTTVQKYKTTEGGASAVCEVMQKYEEIARQEGISQGIFKNLIDNARTLMSALGLSANAVLDLLKVEGDQRAAVLAAL